jgi:hypothetical protein
MGNELEAGEWEGAETGHRIQSIKLVTYLEVHPTRVTAYML